MFLLFIYFLIVDFFFFIGIMAFDMTFWMNKWVVEYRKKKNKI